MYIYPRPAISSSKSLANDHVKPCTDHTFVTEHFSKVKEIYITHGFHHFTILRQLAHAPHVSTISRNNTKTRRLTQPSDWPAEEPTKRNPSVQPSSHLDVDGQPSRSYLDSQGTQHHHGIQQTKNKAALLCELHLCTPCMLVPVRFVTQNLRTLFYVRIQGIKTALVGRWPARWLPRRFNSLIRPRAWGFGCRLLL